MLDRAVEAGGKRDCCSRTPPVNRYRSGFMHSHSSNRWTLASARNRHGCLSSSSNIFRNCGADSDPGSLCGKADRNRRNSLSPPRYFASVCIGFGNIDCACR